MSLANISFSKNPQREIVVMDKKIVIRSLTTKDTLEMNVDYAAFAAAGEDGKEGKENFDIKKMLSNVVEILSSSIVSIDGQVPDSREELKSFLLAQEQEVVLAIFKEANQNNIQAELKN